MKTIVNSSCIGEYGGTPVVALKWAYRTDMSVLNYFIIRISE
ncbi:hypothetical protein [Parvimonas micra]